MFLFGWPILLGTTQGQEQPESDPRPRSPWTTSRVIGSPEPPLPYTSERAFPALKFDRCLDITHAPGTDRLFVAEQAGKIYSFTTNGDVEEAELCVDLKRIAGVENVYAITFHPNFKENRYCYVCYVKASGLDDGTHVARFSVTDSNPPLIDLASEKTIITWLSGGHNGCCLKFGPDGFLYISTGDGEGPNPPDIRKTGQDVTDLLSSLLRIDVDHADGDNNYRIPADNPFVGQTNVRPEIWAYGFRNPWRMSFDKKTGDLWVGDVGWELWELMDRVERGGNYGWAVMEGLQPTNPEWPRGPTPILPPTIEHPHSESSSITDGLTYYGSRLPELHGFHLYADYDTGKFWAFRYENDQVIDHREIADTTHRVVGFGEDAQGEMYFLDHTSGTVHRLIPNRETDERSNFPTKLSESGLFDSVSDQTPAPGVVPYSINAELWQDHATAIRFVAVPDALTIQPNRDRWRFPKNSVLVKTLSLEMEHGNPQTGRKIETQILHFDGQEWNPYTYEWNEEQTDAHLLDASGKERSIDVVDKNALGGIRSQAWRFAGRAECQRCHNPWSGPPLAFNAPQLHKSLTNHIGEASQSQLATFAQIRLLAKPVDEKQAPRIANPQDLDADISSRARAYLHANCAHCHRQHAGSSVLSKMPFDLPIENTDMVGVRPSQGTFGIHNAQVISPRDPYRSILYYRMSKIGGGRMPHIGSTEVDRKGIELIHDWIAQMPGDVESESDPIATEIRHQQRDRLKRLEASVDEKQAVAFIESLLATTSGAMVLQRAVDQDRLSASTTSLVIARSMLVTNVSVRDLFERFLPAEKRVRRLGNVIMPREILARTGDVDRGKQLFFDTAGVQCKNCHKIQDRGFELGPDLSHIGKKLTRANLLESILEPSKLIDPIYVTYLVETTDGLVHTGVLAQKSAKEIVLKDVQNKEIRIPASNVEHLVPQQKSLMPELLLRDMTAQQVADLLAYLVELK